MTFYGENQSSFKIDLCFEYSLIHFSYLLVLKLWLLQGKYHLIFYYDPT